MIRPAVNGVTFVLDAAAKNKVKRVVITSSVAAVGYPAPEDDDYEYDENSWTNVAANDHSAYTKSKTIAERAAWDF
jgi:dihydroflavonol-4-reductase